MTRHRAETPPARAWTLESLVCVARRPCYALALALSSPKPPRPCSGHRHHALAFCWPAVDRSIAGGGAPPRGKIRDRSTAALFQLTAGVRLCAAPLYGPGASCVHVHLDGRRRDGSHMGDRGSIKAPGPFESCPCPISARPPALEHNPLHGWPGGARVRGVRDAYLAGAAGRPYRSIQI